MSDTVRRRSVVYGALPGVAIARNIDGHVAIRIRRVDEKQRVGFWAGGDLEYFSTYSPQSQRVTEELMHKP